MKLNLLSYFKAVLKVKYATPGRAVYDFRSHKCGVVSQLRRRKSGIYFTEHEIRVIQANGYERNWKPISRFIDLFEYQKLLSDTMSTIITDNSIAQAIEKLKEGQAKKWK